MAAKKLEEAASLENQKEEIIKNADKSKKSLEKKERGYTEGEGKLNEEFLLSKRMLDDANTSLKSAIEKNDMLGVKVASELLSSAQDKMKEVEDMREKHKKDHKFLGKKRKLTIDTMFTKIKESCESRSLSKVRKVDDMMLQKSNEMTSVEELLTEEKTDIIDAVIVPSKTKKSSAVLDAIPIANRKNNETMSIVENTGKNVKKKVIQKVEKKEESLEKTKEKSKMNSGKRNIFSSFLSGRKSDKSNKNSKNLAENMAKDDTNLNVEHKPFRSPGVELTEPKLRNRSKKVEGCEKKSFFDNQQPRRQLILPVSTTC